MVRLFLGITALIAPGLVLGQQSDGPNEEQLKILLSGVDEWNAWRETHPDSKIELAGADLSHRKLFGAKLRGASLQHADLSGADLSVADLSGADLSYAMVSGADLSGANLSGANFRGADLVETNLTRAQVSRTAFQDAYLEGALFKEALFTSVDLTGLKLSRADFSSAVLVDTKLDGADLSNSKLIGADLRGVNLKQTDLSNADLSNADISDSDFTDALLKFSNLSAAIFAPRSIPNARAMIGSVGLRTLRVSADKASDGTLAYDIGAIVELRESAKEAGLRVMERDLTCAIERIRNGNPDRPFYARIPTYFLFDLTCNYGAKPDRPLFLIGLLFFLFIVVYGLLMEARTGGQLYVDYLPKRGEKEITVPLNARLRQKWGRPKPSKRPLPILIQKTRFLRICVYFSLQSMFNIGYREFHIGSWIARLQRRPYSIRAVGPLRVASGIQSLLGVALLALWLLCSFGRPFG